MFYRIGSSTIIDVLSLLRGRLAVFSIETKTLMTHWKNIFHVNSNWEKNNNKTSLKLKFVVWTIWYQKKPNKWIKNNWIVKWLLSTESWSQIQFCLIWKNGKRNLSWHTNWELVSHSWTQSLKIIKPESPSISYNSTV